jgi:hypothetical protein
MQDITTKIYLALAITIFLTIVALIISSLAISGNIDYKDNSIDARALKVDDGFEYAIIASSNQSIVFKDEGLAATTSKINLTQADLSHLSGHSAEALLSGAHVVVDTKGLAFKSGEQKYIKITAEPGANYSLKFPDTTGTANQVLRLTDPATGQLEFRDQSVSTDNIINGNNALNITIPNSISLNSSNGDINIGDQDHDNDINIGTNGDRTINIGNNNTEVSINEKLIITGCNINSNSRVVTMPDSSLYAKNIKNKNISSFKWNQIGEDINDTDGNMTSYSVSMNRDGNILAIGSPYNIIPNGTDSGNVKVYKWNGTSWYLIGDSIIGSIYDKTGYSVALNSDGDYLAVGSPNSNPDGNEQPGYAKLYKWTGGDWFLIKTINGVNNEDNCGYSVTLSANGSVLATGLPNFSNNGVKTGGVKVYNAKFPSVDTMIHGSEDQEQFGYSVTLSADGSVLAIGAPYFQTQTGIVRIFKFDGQLWSLKQTLGDGSVGDLVGLSVSLSADGNNIAIGAPHSNPSSIYQAGNTKIYKFDGSTWSLSGTIDGKHNGDKSGYSVSLSPDGNFLCIGVPQLDNVDSQDGNVWIYSWNGDDWILNDTIIGNSNEQIGYSVSSSSYSNNVAIGTPQANKAKVYGMGEYFSNVTTNIINSTGGIVSIDNTRIQGSTITNTSGIVSTGNDYFYAKNVKINNMYTDWKKSGFYINGSADRMTGHSVSISYDGTIIAIGSPGANNNGENSGRVKVYKWNGTWEEMGDIITGENRGGMLGFSVSINSYGNILAIGTPYDDHPNGSQSGNVKVYKWNGSSWLLIQVIRGNFSKENCGFSVSLNSSGTIMAVGSPRINGPYSGVVKVYEWNGILWQQKGSDVNGESLSTVFGHSVVLSGIGDVLAIGDPKHKTNIGKVKVYRWNGTDWSDMNANIYSDGDTGFSIDMAFNGDILAVGSPSYNNDSGNAIIYKWNGNDWLKIGSTINGASGDMLGNSVALNDSGTILALGLPTTSIQNSGSVKIYKFEGGNWIYYQTIETDGYSIAMNSDGNFISITSETGQVFLFALGDYLANITSNNITSNDITSNDITAEYNIFTPKLYSLRRPVANAVYDSFANIILEDHYPHIQLVSNEQGNTNCMVVWTMVDTRDGDDKQFDSKNWAIDLETSGELRWIYKDYPLNSEVFGVRDDIFQGYSQKMTLSTTELILENIDLRFRSPGGENWTVSPQEDLYINKIEGAVVDTIGFFGDIYGSIFSFTGQHKNFMNKNIDESNYGLIVSATNKYINIDNSTVPTTNESLPYCVLTNIDNDKKVFGVISEKEDVETTRKFNTGKFVSLYKKTNINEQRFHVNSVGEGGIWVCNKNGNLENGDYITSTSITGYGGKQSDDLLHNYTVAKITCDCDFSLTKIVKQKLKVIKTIDEQGKTIQEIVYDENGDIQFEDDLDENTQQQMTYPLDTRFLTSEGTIISEEEYNTRLANGEESYIACFAGCTYHCG